MQLYILVISECPDLVGKNVFEEVVHVCSLAVEYLEA